MCLFSARGLCSTEHSSLFVCLSAPSQEFEKNRLVYGLYLLLMSQKLKNIYLTNESLLQGAEKSRLISLAGLTLKKSLGKLAEATCVSHAKIFLVKFLAC